MSRGEGRGKALTFTLAFALVFFLTLALTSRPPADAADVKPKIAFFMFVARDIEAMSLMDSIPSLITMAVSKTGYFEIIERKKLEKEVELEGYKLGSIKMNELYKLGEKLGFDFGVTGDVQKQRGSITANIKVLDIRGQRVIFEQQVTTTEGGLNERINGVAVVLMEKIQEACSVVAVETRGGEAPLVPPHDLRVKIVAKKIRMSWSYADMHDVCGFKVYRARSEEGPYEFLATVSEMFFTDESPVLNETVFYKVTAINRKGTEGGFSRAIAAMALAGPPPPIIMSVEPDIKTSHLKWLSRPGSDTTGFRIYRKEASEKEFNEVASAAAEQTSYSDRVPRDDATYYYALTSIDSKGAESDMSQVLEAKTLKAPDGLKAEGGKIRRIHLSWSVYPYDIEGYIVYRSVDKASGYKQIVRLREKTANSYTDREGLGDALSYWYRVSAFNRSGSETDMSDAVSALTRGLPPVPQGLAAKDREPRRVSLQWTAVKSPDDEIRGYYIFRSDEEKGEYRSIAKLTEPEANSFIDSDRPLKDNTRYFYKIASFNSADAGSELSEPVSSTTKNTPVVPGGLKALSGEVKQVTLTWDPNPEKDIREYIVFRAVAEEKDFDRASSVKGRTVYVDTGLKDGTKYTYMVQAIDEDSLQSGRSRPVSAATKPRPGKPAAVKVSDKGGRKILQWEPNPEKDVKQYSVYKKGFLGISQKTAEVRETSWTIPDDMKGNMEFFITAVDDTGLESEGGEPVIVVIEKK